MLRTKICGITRLEDAEFALDCGANALGFVFWPKSPRAIDPERARSIVASLPPVVTVGVFVNEAVEEVNRIAASVPLSAVQLHGDESVEYAAGLQRPVLKAIAVATESEGDWSEYGDPESRQRGEPVRDRRVIGGRGTTRRERPWSAQSAL